MLTTILILTALNTATIAAYATIQILTNRANWVRLHTDSASFDEWYSSPARRIPGCTCRPNAQACTCGAWERNGGINPAEWQGVEELKTR